MNDLDLLLKEALKHELENRRGRGSIKRLRLIDSCVHSAYANPENWLAGKTVSLIHIGLEGETSLGIFHEFTHKKTSARKLERCPEGSIDGVEYVHGKGWLGGTAEEPVISSSDDTQAIRTYLSRRRYAEVKETLKTISADDLLAELEI